MRLFRPLFRFVPDNSHIRFMRGRYLGLIVSAVLSITSIVIFFYPGLNLGLDFRGGIVMQIQTTTSPDMPALRKGLQGVGLGGANLQKFGSSDSFLISLERQTSAAAMNKAISNVHKVLDEVEPGAKILSTAAVGPSVSDQLFHKGLMALGISILMIMVYIWFRFEWEFGLSAMITLLLDITKTIGFLVVTRLPFDLVTVAAILTIVGYSTNDKVVVYDRIRENLRKYKAMPLNEVINISLNQTLNRTLSTSSTVFLAALPLAIFGGHSLSAFAWTMLFGIIVGTSSSIYIASPILLLLGEKRLRRHSDEEEHDARFAAETEFTELEEITPKKNKASSATNRSAGTGERKNLLPKKAAPSVSEPAQETSSRQSPSPPGISDKAAFGTSSEATEPEEEASASSGKRVLRKIPKRPS